MVQYITHQTKNLMKWLVDEESEESEVTELSDSRVEGSRVTSVLTLAGRSGGKDPELVPE